VRISAVGAFGTVEQIEGGVQLKVNPEAGNIVLLIKAVEVLAVPAVLVAHVPVLVTDLFA
jgi:hypothetical protein